MPEVGVVRDHLIITGKTRRLNRRRFLSGLAGMALAGAALDSLWLEPGWLRVRRIRLGWGQESLRFVHFTDLHFKGDRDFLGKLVGVINGLGPAWVCFTGDIVEEARHLEGALAGLARIRAPLYGVPGNHDYWSGADFERIAEVFAASGGGWLENRGMRVASTGVHVVGTTCSGEEQAEPDPGSRNILLMHYPLWVQRLGAGRFDLILAGHSHGGQVRLPGVGALTVPFQVGRYEVGWFDTPAGPLYVNPGIGTYLIPIRFRCRPEITLFEG